MTTSLTRSPHLVLAALIVTGLTVGCVTKPTGLPMNLADRDTRMEKGYIYYLDGAGGGTARTNWADGVKQGLLEGGYQGAGEMFSWETGRGLIADQDAPVAWKRQRAGALAAEITARSRAYPGVPISLLGFSAGTAEAIFALEKLPKDVAVETVVLLGTSLSQDYNLTKALRRVRGKLFVFTSTHDEMLGVLMPLSGTADRKFADPGAGLHGFVLPRGAGPGTRKLYAEKIVTIPWRKSWKRDLNTGRHFDNVKAPFIRDHVAPLFLGEAGPDTK
jgi:hypothetical protein